MGWEVRGSFKREGMYVWDFPGGLVLKKLPAVQKMQETWVRLLGWDDPLEEGMATHSSILGLEKPRDRGAWQAMVHGVAKIGTQLRD